MSSITITNTGDSATYTISPTLPTGLSINSSTGTISGTPSVVDATDTYTITATNAGGTDTDVITITVNDIVPSITASSSTAILTKDSAMSSITMTNSGGTVITYSVSPSLPSGLSINSSNWNN